MKEILKQVQYAQQIDLLTYLLNNSNNYARNK